jgi:hypothetical protein
MQALRHQCTVRRMSNSQPESSAHLDSEKLHATIFRFPKRDVQRNDSLFISECVLLFDYF